MKSQNDINNLIKFLDGGVEIYQSLSETNAVQSIYSRWPLLDVSRKHLLSFDLNSKSDSEQSQTGKQA